MTTKKIVSLWGIDWGIRSMEEAVGVQPTIHRGEAVEGPKGYTAVGKLIAVDDTDYAAQAAFNYRTRITKEEREIMGVGLTKKEALDLAFAKLVAQKQEALKRINDADRRMTALLKLELTVSKGEE
jgi:hypothetical protein